MRNTTTVVIGGGQAGLAMSRCLTDRSIDHVVLERGEVANSWRTERWDSLRLLTPNWQSRLPGYGYQGDDPDGYRSMPEIIEFLDRYAQVISAPVETDTTVTSVRADDAGYVVATTQGDWRCRTVVLAAGACNIPHVPAFADALPADVTSVDAMQYRNPNQLPAGGVMVVGASATGTQFADEIQRSGRQVTMSVSEHIRAPRTYRGRDLEWWMDATGLHGERYDEIADIGRARRLPSFQLTGTNDRSILDLNTLRSRGVKIVGRLTGLNNGNAQFSGSLNNCCAMSDLKMNRLLDTIDDWVRENGIEGEVEPRHRLEPTVVDTSPPLGVDLTSGEIKTVLWATGYRPDYSWLDVPVLDHKGQVRHDGGVIADARGMYLLGMQFLRRRNSALIDGVGHDARDLSRHLASYLDGSSPIELSSMAG